VPNAWITTGSTNLESVVNPLNAACEHGYVPDQLYILENPGTTDVMDDAIDLATTIVTEYGGDEPEIELTALDTETAFDRIHTYIRDAIQTTHEDDGTVAVDITPGRKFMSAIAFTAGVRYDADHIYYLYICSTDYYGQSYPEMPRTAAQLYDFTEEL
jgi:hypothetical protein